MQVWQLQEPFCEDYELVWALLYIQKIYYVGTNEKTDFYELWQQRKLLKTMEMNDIWPDTYNEGFIHQF